MTNLEQPKAPQGWEEAKDEVKKVADKYRESNPESVKDFKDSSGKVATHISPELVEIIKKDLANKK